MCGCGKKEEIVISESKSMQPQPDSETVVEENAISEEILICDENVQDESACSVNTVDYSDLFFELSGCVVVYDFNEKEYLVYNEADANTQYSPYSSFKIISALMGLHNGVIESENANMNYDNTIYPIESWNANLTLVEAMQTSCVWYFRQVIDKVGVGKVKEELNALEYGNCDVSEWDGSGINPMDDLNGFWLGSSLSISPMEQVKVIKKIFDGDSVYTQEEIDILKNIMLYDKVNDYSIYGKTGTNQNEEGWYVGVVEGAENKYCFAIYITSQDPTSNATGAVAREIAKSIFERM